MGAGRPDPVGKWKGSVNQTAAAGTMQSSVEQMGKAFAESLVLEIKKDGTFGLTAMFVPITGKWTQDGNTLVLKPDTVFGLQAADKNSDWTVQGEIKLRISPDGKQLEALPDDNQPATVSDTAGTKSDLDNINSMLFVRDSS